DTYINALPVTHSDVLRGDQAWGNAVRAKVLMQMKRYADALPYAKKALDLNGTIEDRSGTVDAGDWILTKQAGSNYIYFGTMVASFTEVISPETAARFERGDYVKDYAFLFGMKPGEGGDDDDDDDAEEWDAKATLLKVKDVINGIKAKRKSDAQNTDITDETGPTDDEIGDEGDEYVAPNAANPAWSELFGMMNSGVIGAAQYYSMNANVNCYGITSDRMYYTLAECLIRTGKTDEGLELVNQVRSCRISPDQYAPLTASTETEAMEQLQRSKWIECLCTYENFFDCKRWNSEEKYRRTITRTIMDMEGNISTFEIAPDSKLWILPFPLNVTRKNPTLTQNY
ncbi:MAG: RagB/SusD family nutrient uptake outer membrane protein, partial [Prevotella sp.]|nr:RagB/SusD family nutrient uptake outer membrane protein [Prevotella sp.]